MNSSAELFFVNQVALLHLCALTALVFAGATGLAAFALPKYRRVLLLIGVANACFAAAMLLAGLREKLPPLAGSFLPAMLTLGGIEVWRQGTALLLHLKPRARDGWVVIALVALTMIFSDFPGGDPRPVAGAFFLGVAWLLFRHAWEIFDALDDCVGMALRLAIVAPKLILGGFALLRVVALVMLPASGGLVFVTQPGALNAALFLIVFLNLVGLNVGFGLMIGMNVMRLAEQMRYQARHDLLTDLFNRRAFIELLEREIARQQRGAQGFSVLLIDIDHFKHFNDLHGHLAGDMALVHVADILRRAARAEDVVARFGGEEFCVLLPGTSPAAALAAAERLRAGIAAAPLSFHGEAAEAITASIGVASHEVGRESWTSLLGRADAAMYEAKLTGRNCVKQAPPLGKASPLVKPAGTPSAGR